jgi:hypothetical protein
MAFVAGVLFLGCYLMLEASLCLLIMDDLLDYENLLSDFPSSITEQLVVLVGIKLINSAELNLRLGSFSRSLYMTILSLFE